MRIWIAVTPDKYEHPIALEPSCTALARVMGVSIATISRKLSEGNMNRFGVRTVEVEEETA